MPLPNNPRIPTIDQLVKMLIDLIEDGFYGSLEIKFEKGVVQIIRKTESIKLS